MVADVNCGEKLAWSSLPFQTVEELQRTDIQGGFLWRKEEEKEEEEEEDLHIA